MSVDVKTDASEVGAGGVGILAGLGFAALGAAYLGHSSGLKVWQTVVRSSIVFSMVILAVLLWLLLTDVEKVAKLVAGNQLVTFVLSCVVAMGVLSGAYAYSKTSDTT